MNRRVFRDIAAVDLDTTELARLLKSGMMLRRLT